MADQTVDLGAQVVNVRVMRNDAWSLAITLESPGGTPVNLTGKTISAQLRDRPDSTSSTSLTITGIVAASGQFTVGQAAATVSGFYDVQVTTGSEKRTYVRGRLFVDRDVTRP